MQVAKLALRHEQQLHVLQQDTRLYMFLKPNQDYSVLPLMLQLATGMEDHYGADTGKADYVLARSDDSRPTYGMEESSTGPSKTTRRHARLLSA